MDLAKAIRDPWVRGQLALLAVITVWGPLAPRYLDFGPVDTAFNRIDGWPLRLVGGVLCFAGLAFALWSARTLGRALTPEPEPLPDAPLVTSGPYGMMRHPIYAGIVAAATGWTLAWSNWTLALVIGLLMAWFFEAKARVEERWLTARFPHHEEYARRVRRRVLW